MEHGTTNKIVIQPPYDRKTGIYDIILFFSNIFIKVYIFILFLNLLSYSFYIHFNLIFFENFFKIFSKKCSTYVLYLSLIIKLVYSY